MECIVCHHCKLYWYEPKGTPIAGVVHPPCKNPIRAVKRPPKEYRELQGPSQQMAA